jgi:hypothetical protein
VSFWWRDKRQDNGNVKSDEEREKERRRGLGRELILIRYRQVYNFNSDVEV